MTEREKLRHIEKEPCVIIAFDRLARLINTSIDKVQIFNTTDIYKRAIHTPGAIKSNATIRNYKNAKTHRY